MKLLDVDEKLISKRFDLRAIQEALQLMVGVWRGVLDANKPLDRAKVERLAYDLAHRPESSRALILQSGVKGIGLKAVDDHFRNVLALCYWKFFSCIRKVPSDKQITKFSPRGGRPWRSNAIMMNLICGQVYPHSEGWRWNDFTENSLKSFFENRGFSFPNRD